MTKRNWWIGGSLLVLAFAGLLLWGVWMSPIHVAAPDPSSTADFEDTLAQAPRSVVIAPIVFDLGPAIAQFEADVPRRFGSMDRRLRADSTSRASVAFTASRSPFRVRVEGSKIVIETVLEYEGRAWYNPPLGPEVSAGCGGGNDPKPRLLLRIVGTPSLTPQWGLRTRCHTEVVRYSDEQCDQCRVTFLKVDVTGPVVAAVGKEVTRVLARFDRHVSELDTHGAIEGIWRSVERPIRLADGAWLLLQPSGVQLASLKGGGDTLVAVVHLEARPKIVTGTPGADSTFLTPLPPLRTTADADTALRIVLEGVISYETATSLIRKPLIGKVLGMAGHQVRIEDVTLRGIGSGQVALGVTLSGAVRGRIFLTGTPRLDLATRQLTIPDFDFDLGSADLLARGLSWWQGGAMRDLVRTQVAIPDSVALAGLQRLAEHGMNRELTAGVRLQVRLNASRGMAVWATKEHLILRALAEGRARLAVTRVLTRVGSRSPRGR